MEEILFRSLAAHQRALEQGEYSAEELLSLYLNRIDAYDERLGAFLTLDREEATVAARRSDACRREGRALHALDGIPFAAKDNLCTQGLRTTCGSRMLKDYIPPYDATVISRLRAHGSILVGKLNMDEFGMGSSTEHSALGVTRNPHDPTRVPGGSSGGAAAAVAAGEIPFALASDTGGSVRQPAAFCGVLGLKPTYGALSRYGLVAFASSLDCVGLITRNATDCARVMASLVGKDCCDATTLTHPFSDFDLENTTLADLRLGVVDTRLGNESVSDAVAKAAQLLSLGGMHCTDARLPDPEQALAAYYVLSSAEASSNLSRFDGVRYGHRSTSADTLQALYENSRAEGLGDEVKRRILFGVYVLSAGNREDYYLRASYVRDRIRREMEEQFTKCDLLLLPTAPTAAFHFGERQTPEEMYASDLCTVYASLAGYPAVSVPLGKDADGMPLAVQLIAPPMCEARLLRAAWALEEGMA